MKSQFFMLYFMLISMHIVSMDQQCHHVISQLNTQEKIDLASIIYYEQELLIALSSNK